MTRPQIIRADTIDLQEKAAPSAQDHSRQPTHPAAIGVGPPAPHQAESLREASVEAEEEIHRSPRVSADWANVHVDGIAIEQHLDDEKRGAGLNPSRGPQSQHQDALTGVQNGTLSISSAEDAEMADAEGDDSLDDDDMMDKISSSPSIDDGRYPPKLMWPERVDSLSSTSSPSLSSPDPFGRSSSPFVETPDHFPLSFLSRSYETGQVGPDGLFPLRRTENSWGSLMVEASADEDSERIVPSPFKMSPSSVESYDEDFELSALEEDPAVQVGFDEDHTFDGLAGEGILTFPYDSSDEEDDEFPFPENPRFIDSGWGGECLQDTEDIDFEFVYALHTFVATVEGQANATKGDTMVLLDDSNSYWWLVRVVKDSSIGYLPAEHIETPTERLARLNKHRNIDLSATMLGDQAEKSKNPLKKAIRRRNAKTVTFSAPTYVEASEIDYSSGEEVGVEGEYFSTNNQQAENDRGDVEDEESTLVEPLADKAEAKDTRTTNSDEATRISSESTSKGSSEIYRPSDELADGRTESRSRNGTVRNTDSFKDDSVETRKITITPNLLRDDSSVATRTSNDSKEIRQRPSFDKIEKDAASDKSKDDKKKRDKKEKDKKSGMLSGLFKRKDKKSKSQEDDFDDSNSGKKLSSEDVRSSPVSSKDSEEIIRVEEPSSRIRTTSPQRQPSKLQKQPRVDISGSKLSNNGTDVKTSDNPRVAAPERPPPAASAPDPSMRLVQQEDQPLEQAGTEYDDGDSAGVNQNSSILYQGSQVSQFSHNTGDAIPKDHQFGHKVNTERRLESDTPARVRLDLDDSDASGDEFVAGQADHNPLIQPLIRPSIPGAFPDSFVSTTENQKADISPERLSESPVQISPVDTSRSNPPALMVDTSSQEEVSSPVSSPSPELLEVEDLGAKKGTDNSSSTSTATWSDAHLRSFFDDDSEIKDLLVVVYDKSGVLPAGPDHPITGSLFKEENAKLAEITNRLDNMLGDWLARKMKISTSS